MKLPEKPPLFSDKLTADLPRCLALMQQPDIAKLINRSNAEYLPWEKVKYLPMPEGMEPDFFWSLLRLSRLVQQKNLPLTDTHGQSFNYWITDAMLRELHFIDQYAGGSILSGQKEIPAGSRDRYLVSSLMEEAIASSQIEGAATTRKVAKEMLRTGRQPTTYAERMIYNNFNTIRRIKEFVGQPLTLTMLHDLQRSMTEGTLDDPSASGRFRRPDEPIAVMDRAEGTMLHEPPPAQELSARMERFLNFANAPDEDPFIPPVAKGILLHFWLAYEHPYIDGNGRTARAVFYWHMLSRGYWLFEFLSISRAILGSRGQYERAFLHAEQDILDANYFLAYHLQAIHKALDEMHRYLRRKQAELTEAARGLRKLRDLNHRQQALLQHAVRHPDFIYTIRSHRTSHDVAYGTARADLLELVKKGYLSRRTVGRKFRFEPVANLAERLK